ncbi:hypothetical protein LB526_16660 [Mesorhizobium sp. CA6]|uniref:hypothetical protein n=1 Tax=Mesorhizobium sp. CA6 TaxID=588500 RepID=UPI001CC90C7F|nr:hypothetical protein [Mesorhizobium sp. CA6]MBZ9768389.1 hypothetical protein [Mesorhizobium sp. CA6]
MGKLVLTFDPDWPILDIDIEQDHFQGHGCANFPTSGVSEFLATLQTYPLQRSELALRSPGLINISVFPADGVGHLFVQVEVAEAVEARNFTRVRLKIDYARLSRFANQLSLMTKGDVTEILLEEDKA